jgi:hypothetical protein
VRLNEHSNYKFEFTLRPQTDYRKGNIKDLLDDFQCTYTMLPIVLIADAPFQVIYTYKIIIVDLFYKYGILINKQQRKQI